MAKAHYQHLVQRRLRWFVRIVVPVDVRDVIGKKVLMRTTQCSDQHQAALKAVPIVREFQKRIQVARQAGKRLEQVTAEQLAERYRAERRADPEKADITRITDVIDFVLRTCGTEWADYARQVPDAGYDLHTALRHLPNGDAATQAADLITGHATPFLSYVETWKPHAGLRPRSLDQTISTIKNFDEAVGKPIEQIEARDVQKWIDELIAPDAETFRRARTVKSRLSEIRNYWRWLQSHQIVSVDRNPFSFAGRRVQDPAHRKLTKDEQRQRFRPEDVVQCWTEAQTRGDAPLAAIIKIAAHSGARIEAICRLRTKDLDIDPDTKVRFMRMADKTEAGDRFVPIHPKISSLLNRLINDAGEDGYLIASTAQNKYGERGQPLGKRFGRMKDDLGFDGRYVFHSIRKTVAHMLETAECPPGVAKDILGHTKTDMTFGVYSGETRMDHRARWLAKAVRYPSIKHDRHPEPGQTVNFLPVDKQSESPPSD
jgi:integrase